MVPKLARIGILVNSANSAHGAVLKNVQAAAQKASITVLPVKAQTPQEIESAFSLLTRESAGAVIVTLDPLFISIGMRGVVSVVPTRARLPVNQRLC